LTSAPKKDYKTTGRYFGRDWNHFVDPKEEENKKKIKIISKKIKLKK
jgi:hypothetical protein